MKITSLKVNDDIDTCAVISGEEIDGLGSNAGENEMFVKLLATTADSYDLDINTCRCSKGRVKRWSDMADLWGRCADAKNEPNILAIAIHKIHWGIYPKNLPHEVPTEIVDNVVALLKKDGNAYRGWKNNKYYRDAFDDVLRQRRPVGRYAPGERISWFLRYIRNCLWLQIVYHGAEPPSIDLSHYSREEFIACRKHSIVFNEVRGYETVIKKLIPEAVSWNESQWHNERLLYRKLGELYGINTKSYCEVNKLISFLIELWYYNTTAVTILMYIRDIPESLMMAIWPTNTKYEITRLFSLTYSRVKAIYTRWSKYGVTQFRCNMEDLTKSWIYNKCREWVYNNDVKDIAPRTRTIIYEIDLKIVA